MTLESDRDRGERARRLLDDPMLAEAFDVVERNLHEEWLASRGGQEREREQIWLMIKLLGRVKGQLTEAMETGKVARIQIERDKERPLK